jgi:glycosyltransferase involved in cell wall biosynthesis
MQKPFNDIRIAFAGRDLIDKFSGSSEYLRGFITEFLNFHNPKNIFIYYNHESLLGSFPQLNEKVLPTKNRLLWDHIQLPAALKKDQIDLVLFPKGTRSLWLPCKSVVILLDLGYFYKNLKAYKLFDTLYMKPMIKFSSKRSWRMLSISDHTKKDAEKYLKINPSKIKTIWGGVNKKYKPIEDSKQLKRIKQKYSLNLPFVFYPTSLSPRKNFGNLLKAFEMISQEIPHHIYFTGGFSWGAKEIEKKLASTFATRVHRMGKVAPEDMASLFSLADFIIYPSLLEGFGLPVIEAFQSGAPILTSNVSSMAEIAGDAAHLINPLDPQDIAKGLSLLANNPSYKIKLRARGIVQAKKFTWKKTASTAYSWLAEAWEDV